MNELITGKHTNSLDAKWRVSLPAKHRRLLPESLVIVPENDEGIQFLRVYDPKVFKARIDAEVSPEGTFNPRDRKMVRRRTRMTSDAVQITLDSANRIPLSEELVKWGSLERELFFVGDYDNVMIFNQDAWNKYHDDVLLKTEVFDED